LAWTHRQHEILTLLRDQGETFFWQFPWEHGRRLLHSLEVLEERHGVIKPGKNVKTAPDQSLPSTGSWVLTTVGKSAAAKLP